MAAQTMAGASVLSFALAATLTQVTISSLRGNATVVVSAVKATSDVTVQLLGVQGAAVTAGQAITIPLGQALDIGWQHVFHVAGAGTVQVMVR